MAATFVIQNNDGAGEGFNDPNPPVHANQKGNNPGTTLGELRLNLFQAAADRWGELLNSDVSITVGAQFNDLFCEQFGGLLGSAGASGSNANFGAGEANTAYPIALAESLSGSNQNGGSVEINAAFNSAVDSGDENCLGGQGFYYGLDNNAPVGTTPLFPVVLHELGHGMGFSSLTDAGGTGAFVGAGGLPDTFSRNLHDLETGKSWDVMSNAERQASALNDPDLVWNGSRVIADRDKFLGLAPELVINAPAGIAGIHEAGLGEEPSIIIPENGISGDMVDGDALVNSCDQFNEPSLNGKIVLFDLPDSCPTWFPTLSAQFANAIGVIIANTEAGGLPDMNGQVGNQDVTIPYVGVTKAAGSDLRSNIAMANVTIQKNPTALSGENQDRVRMFAPAVFQSGSSVSHWSSDVRPDLLMESILSELAFEEVDLTLGAFEDMGWSVNTPGGEKNLIFDDGFEAIAAPLWKSPD